MEARKEEDRGPSGLGAFFGRSARANGGGGGGSSRWDGDAARRRRQAEELAERGIFFGEFAEGTQAQAVGNAPPPHQDPPTAVPLHHRTALSEPQPPVALPAPTTTFYALHPLIPTPLSPPNTQVPDFSVYAEAALKRQMQEAHLQNAAQLAQQAESWQMEESLPWDLRDSL